MNDRSSVEVVRQAASDLTELVRDEIALAKHEVHSDVAALRLPLAAAGAGLLFAVVGSSVLLQSLVVTRPRRAGIAGCGLLLSGLALTLLGLRSVPRVMEGSRARLRADVRLAEELIR